MSSHKQQTNKQILHDVENNSLLKSLQKRPNNLLLVDQLKQRLEEKRIANQIELLLTDQILHRKIEQLQQSTSSQQKSNQNLVQKKAIQSFTEWKLLRNQDMDYLSTLTYLQSHFVQPQQSNNQRIIREVKKNERKERPMHTCRVFALNNKRNSKQFSRCEKCAGSFDWYKPRTTTPNLQPKTKRNKAIQVNESKIRAQYEFDTGILDE